MIVKVEDHVERALSRLSQQFQNKPLIEKLVTALVRPMQRWEDANYDLCSQLDPDQAIGVHLDLIGAVVGQPRENRTDADYSRVIKVKIAANNSEGTLEELINVIRLLLNDLAIPITTTWHQPKALEFLVGDDVVEYNKLVDIIKLLLIARDPGTNIYLKFLTEPLANTFQFDTGPGFDSGAKFACVTNTYLPDLKITSPTPESIEIWDNTYSFQGPGTIWPFSEKAHASRIPVTTEGIDPTTYDLIGSNHLYTGVTPILYEVPGDNGRVRMEPDGNGYLSLDNNTTFDIDGLSDVSFLFKIQIDVNSLAAYRSLFGKSDLLSGFFLRYLYSIDRLQLSYNPTSGITKFITLTGVTIEGTTEYLIGLSFNMTAATPRAYLYAPTQNGNISLPVDASVAAPFVLGAIPGVSVGANPGISWGAAWPNYYLTLANYNEVLANQP